jgi:hypothetical protein
MCCLLAPGTARPGSGLPVGAIADARVAVIAPAMVVVGAVETAVWGVLERLRGLIRCTRLLRLICGGGITMAS